MYMQLQITAADGKTVQSATELVGPCNLIGTSMWKDITVDFNGSPCSDLTNTYANYKAYLETVVSFGSDAIKMHQETRLFYPDGDVSNNNFSLFDKAATTGAITGFQHRHEKTKDSKIFEVITKPASDLCQVKKLLPPDLTVTLKFTRASDSFVLNTSEADKDKKYKIKIIKCELEVRYMNLHPEAHKKLMDQFATNYMQYKIQRCLIKTFVYAKGLKDLQILNAFNGTLPHQLAIVLVDADAFNGSHTKNPFQFSNNSINYFCIRENGVQIPPIAYQVDFTNDMYKRLYADFCRNIGVQDRDVGNLITLDAFKKNYCILTVNLDPDCNAWRFHKQKTGIIDVDIRLSAELPNSTYIILFSYTDGILYLDHWRNATTNFAIGS